MNKKKLIALCAGAAVLLLIVIIVSLGGKRTETSQEQLQSTETTVDRNAEETKEQTEPTRNLGAYHNDGQSENTEPLEEETTLPTEALLIPEENIELGVVAGDMDAEIDEEDPEEFSEEFTPAETTQQEMLPTETKPAETKPAVNPLGEDFTLSSLTYESYNAMTGEQQKAVIDLFSSPEEFVRWYQFAEEKYLKEHPELANG